jgi:cbb3-type cytochrome oxidase subunit 3
VTTLIAFAVFVGIVCWAYAPSRKKDFEEQGRMLFDADEDREGR